MSSCSNKSCSSCQNQLIDIYGICEPSDVNAVISTNNYWIQMYIPETLSVPEVKPDIETLNSVDISVNILRAEVIKTPVSVIPNLEGKSLTGRKIIVEGQLCEKIGYTALEPTQPAHSMHFAVPFSAYIVVPETIPFTNPDGTTTDVDSLDIDFKVNACVEDINICILDKRTVFKQVTLLLYAVCLQA